MIGKVNIGLFQLIYIILALNIKFLVLTFHNRMGMLKRKIAMLLKWVSHSLLICPFGLLLQLVFFLSINFLLLFFLTTHRMKYSIKKNLNMIFSRPLVVVLFIHFYTLIINTNWNIFHLNVFSLDIIPVTKVFYVFTKTCCFQWISLSL